MPRPPRHAEFFRVWTPEMAYGLGYWWTDGCMRIKAHGAHEFEISSNDRDHLVTMAHVIGGNYSLRKVSEDRQCYKIVFCSKEMYQDILAHGGTPRKSRTIGFPYVPPDLLPHFVRGVVDGDGTLSWNGDRPILQIYSGSQHFLSDLAHAVQQATGIPAPNVNANRSNWTIKWSTARARSVAVWLYFNNTGLALDRKLTIATRFLEWPSNRRLKEG